MNDHAKLLLFIHEALYGILYIHRKSIEAKPNNSSKISIADYSSNLSARIF